MKKAIVFAAAFAAGSALAQVGTWSGGGAGAGGSMSNMGADGRFGAGPQVPATDRRASGEAPAAARAPRSAGALGASSVGVSGASSAPPPAGSTPIVSGTTWGAAPSGVPADAAQADSAAKRESPDRRDSLEDGAQK